MVVDLPDGKDVTATAVWPYPEVLAPPEGAPHQSASRPASPARPGPQGELSGVGKIDSISNEAMVRRLAELRGSLRATLHLHKGLVNLATIDAATRATTPSATDKKGAKGAKDAPAAASGGGQPTNLPLGVTEVEGRHWQVTEHLDASGLLVGDTTAELRMPRKRVDVQSPLSGLLRGLTIRLGVRNNMEPPPEIRADPGLLAAFNPLGEPCRLMSPELQALLNPLMLRVKKAKRLPDQPATVQQLEEQCGPVAVRLRLLHELVPPRDQVGMQRGPWTQDGELRTRTVDFGQPEVFLMPDLCRQLGGGRADPPATTAGLPSHESQPPVQDEALQRGWELLLEMVKTRKLSLEVHDRTCILEEKNLFAPEASSARGTSGADEPKPSASLIAQARPPLHLFASDLVGVLMEHLVTASMQVEGAGTVFGAASPSLADLLLNRTSWTWEGPLQPATTVRGAAGLDWRRRPGRYMEAESSVKLEVRQAQPLLTTKVPSSVDLPFVRALFTLDYRDTELLHKIERVVRTCNSLAMGFARLEGHGEPLQGDTIDEGEAAAYTALPVVSGEMGDHELDIHVLQKLTTAKIGPEQWEDKALDIVTGFQLIDGEVRMVFLEGIRPPDGNMRFVEQVRSREVPSGVWRPQPEHPFVPLSDAAGRVCSQEQVSAARGRRAGCAGPAAGGPLEPAPADRCTPLRTPWHLPAAGQAEGSFAPHRL